jgi:hypothetical protein
MASFKDQVRDITDKVRDLPKKDRIKLGIAGGAGVIAVVILLINSMLTPSAPVTPSQTFLEGDTPNAMTPGPLPGSAETSAPAK